MFVVSDHPYVIRSDFNEITNSSVINLLKEKLQSHKFNIQTKHDRISSVTSFMKKFVSQIKYLTVKDVDLNSNDMETITYTLLKSNIKVSFVANLFYHVQLYYTVWQ